MGQARRPRPRRFRRLHPGRHPHWGGRNEAPQRAPRELSVVYYSGESVPCPCSVDGVMLAVSASPGQGSVQVAAEKSPPGTFAVVFIWPRKGGGAGLKYTVPMSHIAKLSEINRTIQDPLARYNAVMGIGDLFMVEPVTK
jgi:hypothetical protein